MGERIVVIGAGGFGRGVVDVIEAINAQASTQSPAVSAARFDVVGFLDDGSPDPELLAPYGLRHLGPTALLATLPDDVGFVIGVANPRARATLDAYGLRLGRGSPVLVHPRATLGRSVTLGPGTIVCAGATFTNHITLGRHVHINMNSTIGHDAVLDDYVTLSPQVAISGNVVAHARAFLGTGAKVNPGLTLGADAVVGTGAVVVRDVDAATAVVGVPARSRVNTSRGAHLTP